MSTSDKFISEGLIIAGVPLLGYSLAFAYEYGYAKYYGIPWQLISISLNQILSAVAALLFIFMNVFLLVNLIYMIFSQRKGIRLTVNYFLIFLAPLIALLYIYGRNWQEWIVGFGAMMFLLILWFVLPLLDRRKDKTSDEKFVESILAEPESLVDSAARIIGVAPLRIAALIYMVIWIAYSAGRGEALDKKEYWVDSLRPDTLVLRIYGEVVVAHGYDPKKLQLTGDLIVSKISPHHSINFREQKLGHIKKESL
jgi:hypothetical protein